MFHVEHEKKGVFLRMITVRHKLRNPDCAVEFLYAYREFLKKSVMALGASEEEFKNGIRNPDFFCNSMEDVMRMYACIAQDKTYSCNVIQFEKNQGKIQECLCDWNINNILSTYSSSNELEKRFAKEFKITKKWEDYVRSLYGFCEFIKKINLLEFDKFSDYIHKNSETLEKRRDLILMFKCNIHDVGFAVAANFLKELGLPKSDRYSLYSKPDRHMLDIMCSNGFLMHRDEEDCFIAVDTLSNLCGASPYMIDKIFYSVSTGDYYKFPSIKGKYSKKKCKENWKNILQKIK